MTIMMKLFRNIAIAAVALASTMSFTSCVGDNDDDKIEQTVIALYKSDGTFEQYGGTILVPSQTVIASAGSMYSFGVEYNPNDYEGNRLNVNVTSELTSLDNSNVAAVAQAVQGNVPLYDLNYQNVGTVSPYKFNDDIIIVPVMFWIQNVASSQIDDEVKNHSFGLYYVINDNTDVLDMYLTDSVNDTSVSRPVFTWVLQAFNIRSAVAQFRLRNAALNTIRIHAMVNNVTDDLTDSHTEEETFDIAYSTTTADR